MSVLAAVAALLAAAAPAPVAAASPAARQPVPASPAEAADDPEFLPSGGADAPLPPAPPPPPELAPPAGPAQVAVTPLPIVPPAPAAQAEPVGVPAPEESWIDVGHAFLEQRLFAPVLRFDRFFSDERALEAERARSFVRFREGVRFRDQGTPTQSVDVAANLRFPGLNRSLERVRLVIAAQTEDAVNAILPEGPASALGGGVGHAEAGVRYDAWEGLRSNVDLGAGLLARLPVGTFWRLRYRASLPVRRLLLLRFATSGFWRSDTLFGTAAEAAAERPLGTSTLLRLSGAAALTQRSRGVEWNGLLGVARALGPRSAIAAGAGLVGAGRAPVAVDRYRVFTRYRRDVFRHWIYGELEPEIAWPWTEDRGRFRELAITVRLEIQFHGNEPPIPPPPALRGPGDTPGSAAPPVTAPPASRR